MTCMVIHEIHKSMHPVKITRYMVCTHTYVAYNHIVYKKTFVSGFALQKFMLNGAHEFHATTGAHKHTHTMRCVLKS